MKHIVVDSQEALDTLLEEVQKQAEPLYAALDEATRLLSDAMRQGCQLTTEDERTRPEFVGWYDTLALSTWCEVGDWLVEHAGWECHPGGFGRRQFYRPPQEADGDC